MSTVADALPLLFGPADAPFARTPARKTGRFKDSLGRWNCYDRGRRVSCAGSDAAPIAADRDAARSAVRGAAAEADAGVSPERLASAEAALSRLTKEELRNLKREMGFPANKPLRPAALAREAARRVRGREAFARKARKAGVSPADMARLAADARRAEREHVTAAAACASAARAAYLRREGKPLTGAHPAFRGGDWTQIRGLDVIARDLAGRFPEVLGAHGYEHSRGHDDREDEAYQRLYDLLAAGTPRLRPWAQHYEGAIEYLVGRKAGRTASGEPAGPRYDDEVPFSAAGGPCEDCGDCDDCFRAALADLIADAKVPHVEGLAPGEGDAPFAADGPPGAESPGMNASLAVTGDEYSLLALRDACERMGLRVSGGPPRAEDAGFAWVEDTQTKATGRRKAGNKRWGWQGEGPPRSPVYSPNKPGEGRGAGKGKAKADAPAAKAPEKPADAPAPGKKAPARGKAGAVDLQAAVKAGDLSALLGATKGELLELGKALGVKGGGKMAKTPLAEAILKQAAPKQAAPAAPAAEPAPEKPAPKKGRAKKGGDPAGPAAAMTPGQRQAMMDRHPGMLILVRDPRGDGYGFISAEQADAAARRGEVPAEFTHKELEKHLRALLRAGHRVAIADQMPADFKPPVEPEKLPAADMEDPYSIILEDAQPPAPAPTPPAGDDYLAGTPAARSAPDPAPAPAEDVLPHLRGLPKEMHPLAHAFEGRDFVPAELAEEQYFAGPLGRERLGEAERRGHVEYSDGGWGGEAGYRITDKGRKALADTRAAGQGGGGSGGRVDELHRQLEESVGVEEDGADRHGEKQYRWPVSAEEHRRRLDAVRSLNNADTDALYRRLFIDSLQPSDPWRDSAARVAERLSGPKKRQRIIDSIERRRGMNMRAYM